MATTATCDCGKVIKAEDEFAGKYVKCPKCGESVLLPDPAAVDLPLEDGKSDPAAASGMPPFDFAKALQQIGLGGKISLAAFGIAFLACFLPWYSVSVTGGVPGVAVASTSNSFSGISFTWGKLFFIAAIGGVAAVAARGLTDQPHILRYAMFGILGAAALLVVTVLLSLTEFRGASFSGGGSGINVQAGMGFGWFASLLAALGAGVGAGMVAKEEKLF